MRGASREALAKVVSACAVCDRDALGHGEEHVLLAGIALGIRNCKRTEKGISGPLCDEHGNQVLFMLIAADDPAAAMAMLHAAKSGGGA